jgi:hypothetical protein
MKTNIKNALLYGLNFLIIFVILLNFNLNEGKESNGILIEASVLLVFLIAIFYLLLRLFLKTDNLILISLSLFFLAELSFLCISGQISLFGIFYKLDFGKTNIASDIALYREKRDMTYSTSFILAALFYFIENLAFKKKGKPLRHNRFS